MEVVNSIWLFFQDQILGMKWLNGLIGNGLSLLGLDINSRLGGSIQFFLYDVIKITILLCCIFRKNCASVPEERSAIPLQTEQSSAG